MSKKTFGTTSKGVEASLYEISNGSGVRVLLTDYGASVVSIFVKDKDGNERDVILGYDNVKSYEKEYCYFGATVGRYANRISDAKVNIDGVEYSLRLMTMRTVFTVAQMVFLSASGLLRSRRQMRLPLR